MSNPRPPLQSEKEYLRDGVYAQYDVDRDCIVLTAEDGISVLHRIYIEPETWQQLKGFVKRTMAL